jgi:AraC-like DNA-binding protein
MDALSDVLRVVGLTGGVFLEAEFTEPWTVAGKVAPDLCRPFMVQPRQVVLFHYVVDGGFVLRLPDGEAPAAMKIDFAGMPSGDWIGSTFAYAARTLTEGDPGAATVLAKLSELLFVESVRRHLAKLPPEATGWLAGLRDPVIGRALSLLHARVQEEWTAEKLAHEIHMSRSSFAERFTAVIGQPPMRYLIRWRMQLARQRLRDSRDTVAQIAFAVGYDSEAAFTRAFRRECGAPPAIWRRQAAAG